MRFILLNLVSAFILFNNLEAGIEDFFKKAEGKSDVYRNQIKNIDFIYTINFIEKVMIH